MEEPRFIADSNAGKLARWLRMIGYDTLYFCDGSDAEMLDQAQAENRILLTRDTHILKRRAVTSGLIKAIMIKDDDPEKQLNQVISALGLDYHHKPLSLCLECNEPLVPVKPEEVQDVVPPYVFKKQTQFFRCVRCHRVYWGGSHKKAMEAKLEKMGVEP